jgi:hypothetical protein
MSTAFLLGYLLGAPCGVWLFVKYEAWQDRRVQRRLALERAQAAYDREQAQHFWRTSNVIDFERRA